jgi:hypothetical protein
VNVPYLDAILFVLGISRHEIEEADATTDDVGCEPVTSDG